MAIVRFLGVDLAWGEGSAERPANRSGVVALQRDGTILDAGWTTGLSDALDWIEASTEPENTLLFVDAPLVIPNKTGQRRCEWEVGKRYGRFKVSANSTNLGSPRQAGLHLREALEERGWIYDDGAGGPPAAGLVVSECYPYTTIVGAHELGYVGDRPAYKRAPRGLPASEAWPRRIAACDDLIERIASLAGAEPPMDLRSHPATRELVEQPSPSIARAYKKREDLLDAALCAWTAALWGRHGLKRCSVLGLGGAKDSGGRTATIIAPSRSPSSAAI